MTSAMAHLFKAGERIGRKLLRTDMQYLIRSGFWSNLSSISVSLFSLALYFVFARYLSKEAYGTYQYLLSLGALIGSLTLTGMNTSVAQAVARGQEGTFRAAVALQLKYLAVPFIVSLAVAGYYAFNGNLLLAIGLAAIGIGVPCINTYNTYSAFLLGKKDFRRGFLFNLFINVPYYGALIALAFSMKNPLVLLLANLGVQAVGYYLAYRATLRVYAPNGEVDRQALTLGAHLSFMGILGAVAAQIDSVLAFHFLGAASLAVYSFATAIPDRIAGLLKFLPSAALPQFANRAREEVRAGLFSRYFIIITGLIAVIAAYMLVAPYIYLFLFPQYADAIGYSRWYSVAIIGILTQILIAALAAHHQVKSLYLFNIITPIVQIALEIGGMLFFGLTGLIAARVISTLLALALASILVLR